MTWHDLLKVLRTLAPEELAEGWDRVGIHIEGRNDERRLTNDESEISNLKFEISNVLLCIDLTPAVTAEAVERGCQMIVAYHPPIFEPLSRLTAQTWKERMLLDLVRARVGVYSPHTALDAAEGGVCDWLCDALAGAGTQRRPIKPSDLGSVYKIVTFVPEGSLDAVRSALAGAGAGTIGAYDVCSFSHGGESTFRGGEGTNPTIGEPGVLERVQERRLEMICEEGSLSAALAALRGAHPYEEPAFDVFREHIPREAATGAGRIVTLPEPITPGELEARARGLFHVEHVALAVPEGHGRIRTVGVCPGAGGSLFEQITHVDALVTGEMRHHDVLDHVQSGRCVLLAGHTQTERPYLPTYVQRLIDAGGGDVHWIVSERDAAPTERSAALRG